MSNTPAIPPPAMSLPSEPPMRPTVPVPRLRPNGMKLARAWVRAKKERKKS